MSVIDMLWSRWRTIENSSYYLEKISEAADQILQNMIEYEAVSSRVNIPAYVIGVIHYRESNFNFETHFANGDPLYNLKGQAVPTVHVPKGLGPFMSWREGAVGAFKHIGFDHGYHWDLTNVLDNCERYNGLGYRRLGLASPYVWSGTNSYRRGLYVADGVFDPEKVDPRPGCAAILYELKLRGLNLNERAPLAPSISGELLP